MLELLQQTHIASASIRLCSDVQKRDLLLHLADQIVANIPIILRENALDLERMSDTDPKKDRLMLNEARLIAIAQSVRDVAHLPRP